MAEGGSGETDSLRSFVKKHSKYGTTTKSKYTNGKFRKYFVTRGDTLQGIALKCGVTMEDIKRANNIWTNDSLYLRDYLLIPLVTDVLSNGLTKVNENEKETGKCVDSEENYEIVTRQDLIATQKKLSKSKSCSSALTTVCECPKAESAKDFLSRYDNSFAQIKANVEKLEATQSFEENSDNPLTLLPKKKTAHYGRQKRPSLDSESSLFLNDVSAEPDLLIISSTRNGKTNLKTSVEQLQKTEEDLFQL